MSDWIEDDVDHIRDLAQRLDAAAGYPRRAGRVVGKQIEIQQTWDGRGERPRGWAVTALDIRRRTRDTEALRVNDHVRDVAKRAGIALRARRRRWGTR